MQLTKKLPMSFVPLVSGHFLLLFDYSHSESPSLYAAEFRRRKVLPSGIWKDMEISESCIFHKNVLEAADDTPFGATL